MEEMGGQREVEVTSSTQGNLSGHLETEYLIKWLKYIFT